MMTERNLFTVQQLAERHAFLTEAMVRDWIFHRDTNGFNKCLRRIGLRKWIIDEKLFFEWIDTQSAPPPSCIKSNGVENFFDVSTSNFEA